MGVSVLCSPWARWALLSLPAAGPSKRLCEAVNLAHTPCCSSKITSEICVCAYVCVCVYSCSQDLIPALCLISIMMELKLHFCVCIQCRPCSKQWPQKFFPLGFCLLQVQINSMM